MNQEELNSVVSEKNACELANAITSCMTSKEMTIEHLDMARDIVEHIYRKNALMKKAD